MVRASTRRRRRIPDRHTRFTLGPFVGMRDSLDPSASRPNLARMLRNCYPQEPQHLARVVGRPGFDQLGAQLGGGGDAQFIGQFTKLDGTEYTIAIVGGQFYTLNWGTSTWTEVLTAANLSSASVTLSSTARVYAVTFADNIVFTDGTNTPWAWDGTTNGGITSMTNAPVAFGAPTVYYGKLFFIKATERSTLVWSEENALNTGYEAGGYNNAWTLGQTDADALTRLVGANEALYVFRERSLTAISGEVNANFASTGTREAVSNTIGTRAPASVFFDGLKLLFVDADGRPHVLQPGGQPVSIWEDFRETLKSMDSTKFDEVEGFWDPTLELATFAYEELFQTERSAQLCYHATGAEIPQAASVFSGYTFTRIGVVKNADGDPRVLHGSTDGYIYQHGVPNGTIWEDGFNSGDVHIAHVTETGYAGYEASLEQHFDWADVVVSSESDATYGVSIRTDGLGNAQNLDVSGSVALWDVAQWDNAVWSSVSVRRGSVGFNEFGFYASVRITHGNGSERFGLVNVALRGRPLNFYRGTSL